mmetsp:Transcript_11225/g.40555  ORF Transcript_11225/g.40555 Transcript_11225/m.40555 type:complete len:214 (+) Transcript_11225:258-899(+)
MYMILSNRDANLDTSSPIPALGGSTRSVLRSYALRSSNPAFVIRSYFFPLSRTRTSSSAESLTTFALVVPFVSKFSTAAATDTLLISVARTLRYNGASATVKLPLPQYSSRKSSSRRRGRAPAGPDPDPGARASSTETSLAHSSIFSHVPLFGCVKPPSSCLYVNFSPSTVRVSITNGFPRTIFCFLLRPMTLTFMRCLASSAAASHAASNGR